MWEPEQRRAFCFTSARCDLNAANLFLRDPDVHSSLLQPRKHILFLVSSPNICLLSLFIFCYSTANSPFSLYLLPSLHLSPSFFTFSLTLLCRHMPIHIEYTLNLLRQQCKTPEYATLHDACYKIIPLFPCVLVNRKYPSSAASVARLQRQHVAPLTAALAGTKGDDVGNAQVCFASL